MDAKLKRFLENGYGKCPLGADEDNDGYACWYEGFECIASKRMGCCPYELAAEARKQFWIEAIQRQRARQEQDPFNLGLPLDEDLQEDDPWETG